MHSETFEANGYGRDVDLLFILHTHAYFISYEKWLQGEKYANKPRVQEL